MPVLSSMVPRVPISWLLAIVVGLALPLRARASPTSDVLEDSLVSGDIDADDIALMPSLSRGVPRGHTPTSISIAGFTRPAIGGGYDTGGLVVLGIPLEKLAPSPDAERASAIPADANGVSSSLLDDGAPRSDRASEVTDMATLEDPTRPSASRAALFQTGETLVLSPQLVRACVAVALRTAGLGRSDDVDRVVSRARWSAALPEVRLRAVQHDDERLYTDVTTATDASRLRDATGAQVSLEARLTWRLDHLLYAEDEPAFERIKNDHRDARARVSKHVLEALFQWQRAWAALRTKDDDVERKPSEEVALALRAMEAEATLDVLTGGWFSEWRAQSTAVLLPAGSPKNAPRTIPKVSTRADPDPPPSAELPIFLEKTKDAATFEVRSTTVRAVPTLAPTPPPSTL